MTSLSTICVLLVGIEALHVSAWQRSRAEFAHADVRADIGVDVVVGVGEFLAKDRPPSGVCRHVSSTPRGHARDREMPCSPSPARPSQETCLT